MGDGNFRPPTESTPLDRSPKNLIQVITSAASTLCKIWCKSIGGGLLGKWVKYNEIFFKFIFFLHELTYRSDPSTDFYAWWLKQRGLAQGCAFGGFVDVAPHFGGEIPQKPQFWAVNRRFQAKLAKYWKFHVIENTSSISTKFCTTIETIKRSSWVVPIGAQQIQDGGRPPLKKPLNRHISIRFGTVTHIGLLQWIYH